MSWVVIGQRTPLSASLPGRTSMLALLQGTSGVGLAAFAAAPLSGSAPPQLYAACALLLVSITAGLLLFGSHIGDRGLLALAAVRLVVVALTLSVAGSGGAAFLAGAGLIWVMLWVTGFFPTRIVVATFVTEVLLVAMAVSGNPDHGRTAIDVLPMLTAALVLSMLLRQVLNGLHHEARHDELTGLLNRRGLDQAVRELSHGRRFAGSMSSLVVIDLDGLKLINDRAGHLAGDQMLVTLSTELQTAARGVDLTARIGGDEFVAILPGLSASEATRWAERFHAGSSVAWSYGVAERSDGEALLAWLGRADQRMYAAKSVSTARTQQFAALA